MRRMTGLRGAIAQAAAPWKWRSRMAVVALVVVAIIVTVAMVLSAWTDEPSSKNVWVAVWTVVGGLVLVRPAVRSLRRWDDAHRHDHSHIR